MARKWLLGFVFLIVTLPKKKDGGREGRSVPIDLELNQNRSPFRQVTTASREQVCPMRLSIHMGRTRRVAEV